MLRVYNTISEKKEEFKPLNEKNVGIYACGMTVYDKPHIGHARKEVAMDVVVKYLRYLGYNVNYVRNFTDVDDKIIARANERNISTKELSEENIQAFYDAMDSLNIARPDKEPKATMHIDEIIKMVEKLIENGHAYEANGSVYFSVKSFKGYGKLSKRNIDDMISGTRFTPDPEKKFPLDFALWKKSKPNEPKWQSPWGEGRPGWHIECSAMSTRYLGESFDIHAGGRDLIFPHHENEIAQSEGTYKKQFVKYWVHNGFLSVEGEKMSKSLGNFITVEDALKLYHPEVLRYFLLSTQYRTPIDFSMKNLEETEKRLNYFYTTVANLNVLIKEDAVPEKTDKALKFIEDFKESMDDDFNTAKVVASFYSLFRFLNDSMQKKKTRPSANEAKGYIEVILEVGNVLGVLLEEPEKIIEEIKSYQLSRKGLNREDIEELIFKRNDARKEKDYKKADELRDKLLEMGVVIKDTPTGTIWSFS